MLLNDLNSTNTIDVCLCGTDEWTILWSCNRSVPQLLNVLLYYNNDQQAVPTSNGTSFDFVTTENGPVCLDLYSTPQYKMDKHSECTGEPVALCFDIT